MLAQVFRMDGEVLVIQLMHILDTPQLIVQIVGYTSEATGTLGESITKT